MAYADQQMSGNKIIAIIIVALIHVAIGYALVTGLAYSAFKKAVERVTTVDIEEPPPAEEEPPPPPEPDTAPPPPVAPPPPINIAPAPPPIQTQDTIPPPAPPARIVPRSAAGAASCPRTVEGARRHARRSARWAARIQENYPARAIRDETEGTVGVRVTDRRQRPRDLLLGQCLERIERARRSGLRRHDAVRSLQSRRWMMPATRRPVRRRPASFTSSADNLGFSIFLREDYPHAY